MNLYVRSILKKYIQLKKVLWGMRVLQLFDNYFTFGN